MQVQVNIRDLIKGSVLADAMSDTEKREFIMAVSERMEVLCKKYCPKDKGNLRSSLEIEKTSRGVIYSYKAPYAPYVHEILYRKHKRPTRAKWLVAAFSQAMKELIFEFGNSDIPSFGVNFSATPILTLELTTSGGVNWRDFV